MRLYDSFLHDMIHLLGFHTNAMYYIDSNQNGLPPDQIHQAITIPGESTARNFLVLSAVLAEVESYFSCSNPNGAELEGSPALSAHLNRD